jgi:hypothetical protein
MYDPKRTKWRQFDEAQAKAVADAQRPDAIYYPSTASCAPTGMLAMPGFVSWMGSNASTPYPSSDGVTIGGQLVVLRTDGTLTKVYQHQFGTSSDGSLCYRALDKDFPTHHIRRGQQVLPADFFRLASCSTYFSGGSTVTMPIPAPSALSTSPTFGTNDPSPSDPGRTMLMTTATAVCTSIGTSNRSS